MSNDSASGGARDREFAVLALVPGIVGALIVARWALAHWKIGPLGVNAGLALLATLFGGWQRFLGGFQDIWRRRITVNVFVTVALIATLAVGEFRPAAIIIFIMAVVGALESYTLDKTRRAIRDLLRLAPATATVRSAIFSTAAQEMTTSRAAPATTPCTAARAMTPSWGPKAMTSFPAVRETTPWKAGRASTPIGSPGGTGSIPFCRQAMTSSSSVPGSDRLPCSSTPTARASSRGSSIQGTRFISPPQSAPYDLPTAPCGRPRT